MKCKFSHRNINIFGEVLVTPLHTRLETLPDKFAETSLNQGKGYGFFYVCYQAHNFLHCNMHEMSIFASFFLHFHILGTLALVVHSLPTLLESFFLNSLWKHLKASAGHVDFLTFATWCTCESYTATADVP